MNNRAVVLSLVMAVIAVFFVESYVSSIQEDTKKKFGAEVLVVVAKDDINEMATINETMLELKRIPKQFLEPAAISYAKTEQDTDVTKDMRKLAGTVAVVPIKKGSQLTFAKITEPSIRTGLAPQVTPGRRAISIPVNEITGVGKLVKPGDRVDVIAALDVGTGKGSKLIRTILQDVIVLAVGRNVTNNVPRTIEYEGSNKKPVIKSLTEFDGFTSVTLEVDPTQVQVLAAILSNGVGASNSIMLSLRNNDDTERVSVGGVTIYDVLGSESGKVRTIANTK